MAKKLDRSRDFGIIQGDSEGRMFEQDGVFFLGDGSEWAEPKKRGTKSAPAADSVRAPATAIAAAIVDDQIAAQMQD